MDHHLLSQGGSANSLKMMLGITSMTLLRNSQSWRNRKSRSLACPPAAGPRPEGLPPWGLPREAREQAGAKSLHAYKSAGRTTPSWEMTCQHQSLVLGSRAGCCTSAIILLLHQPCQCLFQDWPMAAQQNMAEHIVEIK